MRTINAPGVEIKEIDKSQYAKTETGTKCYIMGFANKGEPYVPMEFSSRNSWLNYYGEPDNEAERYFFNACMEVINQGGTCYCARLPYDNISKDKMVAHKFSVSELYDIDGAEMKRDAGYNFPELSSVDSTIKKAFIINSSEKPYTLDLADVDEFRADEKKVANNTFLIVDKTCAAYKRIMEDERKDKQREFLGIVPVVTTAANALYAQSMINVENYNVKYYESLGRIDSLGGETGGINAGDAVSDLVYSNPDLVRQINTMCKDYTVFYTDAEEDYKTLGEISEKLSETLSLCAEMFNADTTVEDVEQMIEMDDWVEKTNGLVDTAKLMILSAATALDDDSLRAKAEELSSLSCSEETKIGEFNNSISRLNSIFDTYAGIHSTDGDDSVPPTVSREANTFFSAIQMNPEGTGLDRTELKKIGIVVYKTFIDPSEGNKIAFEPVEAFVGSLCKDDKDINTGITTFIDTIVNSTSQYINVFSNCFNNTAAKKQYNEEADILICRPTDNGASLGFYSNQVEEDISLQNSIYDGMNKCFDKVTDVNERDIDIVCDAGLANIGSFIKDAVGGKGKYDLDAVINEATGATACSYWKCDNSTSEGVKTWKTIEQKFDNFCKNIRKDCMFIADGLRPLVISGQKKIVRPTKPTNSIDANILPNVKNITGLNTNYGAGYMDWFQIADEFTGDFFWCPPSIKAMGVYIFTDTNYNYWDAPAGLNRGLVSAVDVAFSPNAKQAGTIYEKNWNYAINYPQDGIVLEGQKTFQVKPSAFDRVNVRRLFLRLERQTYKVARYFVYEGNTQYTRQRLIDTLSPIFNYVKANGGMYDYKIICDESINTPEVIDNCELKVKIGIKPVKAAEFILIDFIALSTGGSWAEM